MIAAQSRRIAGLLAATAGAVVLGGCATYSSSFGVVERDLAARQYDAALQGIEKQAESKIDRVPYLLNKGMVLRMKGDFAGSNQVLEAAKTEMGRLYAVSVSENTLSFIVNDATVSYVGDDYEQVLLHLYMALNYLELGQPNEARVEALQVDIKLRELGENKSGSKFTEDALSRYLTGMIYEERGEWSDALIAYRKAYEAYKKYKVDYGMAMPVMLKQDLLRLTKRLGLADEAAKYRKEFGAEAPLAPATGAAAESKPAETGELVFVLNNGLAPIKREKDATVLDPVSGILVRIALPYYESRSNDVVAARISVSGREVETELMEDVDGIARKTLDARLPAITARSIARAVVKVKAQKSLGSSRGNTNNDGTAGLLGSFAMQVAAIATERADTRSWLTLPANIQLARLPLPSGRYTIKAELLGAGGQVVAIREYPEVEISRGHKTYLTEHWVPAQPSTKRRKK